MRECSPLDGKNLPIQLRQGDPNEPHSGKMPEP